MSRYDLIAVISTVWLISAWSYYVLDQPDILVSIDGTVYAMIIEMVTDEDKRLTILKGRDYDPVPGPISDRAWAFGAGETDDVNVIRLMVVALAGCINQQEHVPED